MATKMISHRASSGQHAHAERGADLYETPAIAIEKLLAVERPPHYLWEPACGRGAIVHLLRKCGYLVIGSDLNDYGDPTCFPGRDFLKSLLPRGCEGIITNPPYRYGGAFARHALEIGTPYVAMLLRLAFLESVSRSSILDGGKLARVHVFKKRLPMMHRDGWQGRRASSAIAFAWFVWEAAHSGPATLTRL